MASSKQTKVTVKATDCKVTKKVSINEALELLKHPKTAWKLEDAKHKFNGNDIIKNPSSKDA